MFRRLHAEHSNVGLALQSYLYRTDEDLESLLPLGAPLRLVKGAYAEPAEIAYPKKRDVDASYERLAFRMLEHAAQSGDGLSIFGTHDPGLIRRIQKEAARLEVDPARYEFDLLYGIGTGEQERLQAEGSPLRVLISYGSAWFPWYMRRLAERPANVWFVVRSALRG
jgi:proline dehydrogenase